MKTNRLLFAIVFVALLMSVFASAQVTPSDVTPLNDTGVQPFGNYDGLRELVNLSNGNLTFEVPLLRLKGRAGQDLYLAAQYNSKNFTLVGNGEFAPSCTFYEYSWDLEESSPGITTGWRFNLPFLSGGGPGGFIYVDFEYVRGPDTPFIFTTPDGAKVSMVAGPMTDSGDASNYRISASTWDSPAIVMAPDGTKYYFDHSNTIASKIVDRNGNVITITTDPTTGLLTEIRDNLNRPVTFTYPTGQVVVHYVDSNSISRTITLAGTSGTTTFTPSNPQPTTLSVNTNHCKDIGIHVLLNDTTVGGGSLASITLNDGVGPDDYIYSFEYQSGGFPGEISKINYPTGGYTNYYYTTSVVQSSSPAVPTDTREISQKTSCENSGSCHTTKYDATIYNNAGNNSQTIVTEGFGEANPVVTTHNYTASTQAGCGLYCMPWLSAPGLETSSTVVSGGKTYKAITYEYTTNLPALVSKITTMLDDESRSYETFTYDSTLQQLGGNLQSWQVPNVLTHKEYGYDGSLLRQTSNTWNYAYFDNGYEYNPHLASLKATARVYGADTTPLSFTEYSYDTTGLLTTGSTTVGRATDYAYTLANTQRGNLTSVTSHSLINCGADQTTTLTFDTTGNLRLASNGNGNFEYLYDDNWEQSAACLPASNSSAFLTKITKPLPGHVSTYKYFSCTGLLQSATDPNNQTSTFGVDALGRLTSSTLPLGGRVLKDYGLNVLTESVLQDEDLGVWSKSRTTLDGLGRVKSTELCEDGAACASPISTDITYDFRDRKRSVTNPHRSGTSPTDGTTYFDYDALDRGTVVTEPDGGTVNTSYVGPVTVVTDEAGKQRESTSDALGRLVKVREPNATTGVLTYITNYGYDALGNLLSVAQLGDGTGARNRSFTYNGQSKLCSATNPESGNITQPGNITHPGTINYTYDAFGDMRSKTDGRNQTVSYCYDPLHRNTKKQYANDLNCSVPNATYTYDVASALSDPNPIGRRTGMSSGTTSASWTHDPMGRVDNERRTINGVIMDASYGYFTGGALQSISYPHLPGTTARRTVKYAYDPAGRAISALEGTNTYYATATEYAPTGAMTIGKLGTAISLTSAYQNRLQPQMMVASTASGTLLSRYYDFHSGAGDNGNVYSIIDNLDSSWTRNFTYDAMNRLAGGKTPATSITIPATQSSGYVDISGPERTVSGGGGSSGSGSITITASEQWVYDDPDCYTSNCPKDYDVGTVSVTVNGFTKSATYSKTTTASTVAAALASAFNSDSASPVTATAPVNVLTLTAKTQGSNTNYAFVTSSHTGYPDLFGSASYAASPASSAMTGGTTGATIYDNGTVSITVGNTTARTASYGQGSDPTSVASALAAAFVGHPLVSVTSIGGRVQFTSIGTGDLTNYPISVTSSTGNPSFTGTSFPGAALGMSGGKDADGPGQWGNTYLIDPWGNLTDKIVDPNRTFKSGFSQPVNVKNQFSNFTSYYDLAGNLTLDLVSGMNYTYDAENRISVAGPTTYTYDADGQRVAKSGASTMLYFAGSSSDALTETNASGIPTADYIFFNGKRVARIDNLDSTEKVHYLLSDHLGSVSKETSAAGEVEQTNEYGPYGELFVSAGTGGHYKFTGKERDTETGLDYFGARYYSSNLARFTSPDPKLLTERHLMSPQKWNKYTYVQNNPLVNIDPDGLDDYKVFILGKGIGGNWKKAEAAAHANGHTFKIYRGAEATIERMNDALGDSNARVVFVGHTSHAKNSTKANALVLANGRSAGPDSVRQVSTPTTTPGTVEVTEQALPRISVNANSVAAFGCNSADLAPNFSSTNYTAVNSGVNGGTTLAAEGNAGAAWLTADAAARPANRKPADDAEDPTDAANEALRLRNIDRRDAGDTVENHPK